MGSVGLPSKIYTASIVINLANRNLLTLATSKGDIDFRALDILIFYSVHFAW